MAKIDDIEANSMIKVVVTGVECSGKSTLAAMLAKHYHAPLVCEYARGYLSDRHGQYGIDDLPKIAAGQINSEKIATKTNPSIIICDTGMLVMKIWSEFKYGYCHNKINDMYDQYSCDLMILPHYNIPYKSDSLRENEHERAELYDRYLSALTMSRFNYILVSGEANERLSHCIKYIDSINHIQNM